MVHGTGFWNGVSRTGLDVRGSSVALAGAAADAIPDPLETQLLAMQRRSG